MTTHPQARVRVRDLYARVDRDIAALIRSLWQLDITTLSSCQGGPEDDVNPLAYITFPATSASDFLAAVTSTITDPADALHRRIARISTVHTDEADPWYLIADRVPDDTTVPLPAATCRCCWTWTADGRRGWLSATLRFPAADIPLITGRVAQLPRHRA